MLIGIFKIRKIYLLLGFLSILLFKYVKLNILLYLEIRIIGFDFYNL